MQDQNLDINGPTLILAGAGTGKTTTIVNRIINLLQFGVLEGEILAVTFTNKAANEMKTRIGTKLGKASTIWCGTFHGICLRLLKIYYKNVEIDQNFIILDENDRKKIIQKIILENNIDDKRYPLKLVSYILSAIKNQGIINSSDSRILGFVYKDLDVPFLYDKYLEKLKILNGLDFDDLILKIIELFNKNEQILSDIQDRFKYILVDEYQDTNKIQHTLINKLASKHKNITCVGDEDQSIYGWRGAEIKHILNFPKEFENAKILKLEENFRSTQEILDCAMSLISTNKERYEKKLFSSKHGEKPICKILSSDKEEGFQIAKDINQFNKNLGIKRSNIAILVRASYQMRSIEESLIEMSIPYDIVDGLKFYERKEIKDILSYLKFIYNPRDAISFERAISIPRRGIGEKTIEEIINDSESRKINLLQTIQVLSEEGFFKQKNKNELEKFIQIINLGQESIKKEVNPSEIIERIYFDSGYYEMLKDQSEEDETEKSRIENIKELLAFSEKFDTVGQFLEHISLVTEMDNENSEEDKVKILTIHGSKGLEFEAVMIPGFESDIIPSKRAIEENQSGLEEERRLIYVAITRAKKYLNFYICKKRLLFGKIIYSMPSMFLKEISKTIEIQESNSSKNVISDFQGENYTQKNRFLTTNPAKSIKKIENYNQDTGLRTGSEISHEKFGKGLIVGKIGNFYEINFEDGLKRVISASFLK